MSYFLRKVQEEFDWQEYAEGNYAVKYTSNGELRVCCFSCGDDKFKLYINPDKGVFNCFKCSFNSGNFDVFDFVARTEGTTRGTAVMRLTHAYTPTTPVDLREALDGPYRASDRGYSDVAVRSISSLPAASKRLTDPVAPEEEPFWSYLASRGLTEAEILAMSTHYVPSLRCPILDETGHMRGDLGRRVIWPVYGGAKHGLVSWVSRTINPNYSRSDKYLNCPDSDQAKTLWPYATPRGESAVVVEGILDAVAVRRLGLCSYASFGKKISLEQFKILKSWGVTNITIFFDKKDAKAQMLKVVEEAKMYFATVCVPDFAGVPKSLDAGDCLIENSGKIDIIREALSNSVDVYSSAFLKWQLLF